jgi:oligopeptide transport system ATP-binding protein
MTPLLEVTDLRKVFHARGQRDFVAVDGVNLTIQAGGSLAIVGESGSGKTTVARIVAGLESATAGKVMIDGEERPRKSNHATRKRLARHVQMVFQDPYASLDPRQTVANSLDEALRVHFDDDEDTRNAKVANLLEQVGLDARHGKGRPSGLSGGQRQRVVIARALALEPRLLILDEAVSALDVSVQAQVINVLIDVRASLGIGFLFISHDLAVTRQIADVCVVMHRGRVVEKGLMSQILDAPSADYTKQLISAVPRPGWKPRRTFGAAAEPAAATPPAG